MNAKTAWAAVGVVGVALGLAGCDAPAAEPSAAPIVLSVGTDDSPGVPSADEIEEFARQVAKLSDGAITVQPRWHAAGDVQQWDQAVAGMVTKGDLDLALVPSRTWGALGATSLETLGTPFLIQSDELLAAVLSAEVADDIMATLPDAGAVGIGMFPEGLRHPFGFGGVLGGPADYRGKVVRAAASEEVTDLYAAFGATTSDAEPDPSTQVGTDSSYLLKPYGTAAGNVTLYPKVNVLVAGSATWATLSEPQQALLKKAAANTLDWAAANVPGEAAAATAFCAQGGLIAAASATDVAALEAAAAPVVQRITATPGNAGIIAAITALRDAAPAPAPVVSCEEGVGPATVDAGALNGTYRYEITADEWAAAGVTDPAVIDDSSGKYTNDLRDGAMTYTMTGRPNGQGDYLGHGTYDVDGDTVTLHIDGYVLPLTLERNAAGDLLFSPTPGMDPIDVVVLTSQPWVKVG